VLHSVVSATKDEIRIETVPRNVRNGVNLVKMYGNERLRGNSFSLTMETVVAVFVANQDNGFYKRRLR